MFPLITKLTLLIASIFGIVYLQQAQINSENIVLDSNKYKEEERKLKVQLELLEQSPSLGFGNVIANWIYLQYIQYFGDNEARNLTGYSLIPAYFAGVVNYDPRFVRAMLLLETSNTLFAADPQKSIVLLDKSLGKINPTFLSDIGPYYLWRAKGNNELLFLGDVEAAKQSYQKSKEWAKAIGGADSERMIEINQRSINFLDSNPNSKNARVGAWVSILANQHDKKTAEKIIQQIKQLGAKIEVNEDGTIKIIVNANQD